MTNIITLGITQYHALKNKTKAVNYDRFFALYNF
jgi:hypothetical protein